MKETEILLHELNRAIRRTEERLNHRGVEMYDIYFSIEPLYEFSWIFSAWNKEQERKA